MRIEEIAEKGDDLATMIALRQKLARTIDESRSGRDIASLTRQLQIVLSHIEELERRKQINDADSVIAQVRRKHAHQSVRDQNGRPRYYQDTTTEDVED